MKKLPSFSYSFVYLPSPVSTPYSIEPKYGTGMLLIDPSKVLQVIHRRRKKVRELSLYPHLLCTEYILYNIYAWCGTVQ